MFYEKITQQELSDMERPDGITPNYTFEKFIIEKDEQGNIIGEYYINLTINKTADEVYQESLVPIEPDPDEMEALLAQVAELESMSAGLLLENANYQIKLQEQDVTNKEQEVTNANLLLDIAMLKGVL